MNRRSIRFTLAISVCCWSYNVVLEDGVVCEGISFAFHYLTLVYFFLNVAVALNLQLVFVHGVIAGKKHELIYWYVCIGLPYVLLLFPLSAGKIGQDNGYCEFRDPTTLETNLYVYLCFLVWCISSCLYCAVAVILVTVRLRQKVTVLDCILKRTRNVKENSDLKKKVEKLIFRISLYCIIPVVTQVGYIILRVIASYDPSPYLPLIYISVVGSDVPGILNLLVLLLDPAFSSAVESVLLKRGIRVPKMFVDSSEIQSEDETVTIPDDVYQSEEVGFFVSLKSRTKKSTAGLDHKNPKDILPCLSALGIETLPLPASSPANRSSDGSKLVSRMGLTAAGKANQRFSLGASEFIKCI
ncbi:hypothetical protein DSO57_1005267 [Entomophthora muscae]|uniref:Uncharacterized protein n=1 Tax=Entomophthora muscae TaxID=34485 RepID=A0ACC2SXQ8_9FUNG|nr:hypothetical protein DSO57_1005267 [Entomophthora muscae]